MLVLARYTVQIKFVKTIQIVHAESKQAQLRTKQDKKESRALGSLEIASRSVISRSRCHLSP